MCCLRDLRGGQSLAQQAVQGSKEPVKSPHVFCSAGGKGRLKCHLPFRMMSESQFYSHFEVSPCPCALVCGRLTLRLVAPRGRWVLKILLMWKSKLQSPQVWPLRRQPPLLGCSVLAVPTVWCAAAAQRLGMPAPQRDTVPVTVLLTPGRSGDLLGQGLQQTVLTLCGAPRLALRSRGEGEVEARVVPWRGVPPEVVQERCTAHCPPMRTAVSRGAGTDSSVARKAADHNSEY